MDRGCAAGFGTAAGEGGYPPVSSSCTPRLADNPYRAGKPLRFELEGIFGARRGDYRVLYTISDKEESVTVVAVQHRADAYRAR